MPFGCRGRDRGRGPLLHQEKLAQIHGAKCSDSISKQAGRNGMAATNDTHRTKVDSQYVKRCF